MSNLLQPTEEWKPVPNYPRYEVSSLGRVRSLDFWLYKKICKGEVLIKGRILKYIYTVDGYRCVMLYHDKLKRKSFSVRSLVFFTFNPHIKKVKGYEVDHDDQIKTNDALYNLKYITCRQNSSKRSLHQKKSSAYTGVSWSTEKNKWQAHIRINSKSKYLGRYDNEIDASIAYQNALKQIA